MHSYQGQCYPSLQEVPNEILAAFIQQNVLSETIAIHKNKLVYWEEHYLRLMASMRILRMEIPLTFTLEFLAQKIDELRAHHTASSQGKVTISVVKMGTPSLQHPIPSTAYSISIAPVQEAFFGHKTVNQPIDLYKDHYAASGLFSSLESAAQQWRNMAWTFVIENDYCDGILLNNDKQLVETLHGSLFLVKGNEVSTPALDQGCRKTVYRSQLIRFLNQSNDFDLKEDAISPFSIQKADEVFVLVDGTAIYSVPQYRKKKFSTSMTKIIHEGFSSQITQQL
ncbi:MAG: aminotransferase class IV [Flavobacteriaceae bacterium]